MPCSHPQTPATAGRPQGGAGSQLQRQEEGSWSSGGAALPAVSGHPQHSEPPGPRTPECSGGLILLMGASLPSSPLVGHIGQERCGSFQRSLGALKVHSPQSVNPSHRQRENHGPRGPQVPRWGRGTQSGSISI